MADSTLVEYAKTTDQLAKLCRELAFLRSQELMEEVKVFQNAHPEASIASLNREVKVVAAVIKQEILIAEGEYEALKWEARCFERVLDAKV
jgi:hypothetical protein